MPDTLRNGGPRSVATEVNSHHPLEARLKHWDETQMNLKMEGLRRLYGAAEPIRRGMEVRMCAVRLSLACAGGEQCADDGVQDYKPLQLGGPSNLHKDILENRDCLLDWEDVYPGNCYPLRGAVEEAAVVANINGVPGNQNVFELPEFHTELEAKCLMNW